MSPVTHFLAGWMVANVGSLERRERNIVTVAGIAPDVDAFGAPVEKLTLGSESPLLWWTDYHHVLCHNLGFGLLLTLIAFVVGRRRWRTAGLAFLAFHLHLLGDLVGARGPDDHQWPIHYLLPFSGSWKLTWDGQWFLNAWPNFAITGVALIATFFLAWRRGFSPLGVVSTSADKVFVATLRRRLPRHEEPGQ